LFLACQFLTNTFGKTKNTHAVFSIFFCTNLN
jgi:hypothetical protein